MVTMADLPAWLKAEIESSDDLKVIVSVKWLISVVEKAGIEMPEEIAASLMMIRHPDEPVR